MDYVKLLSELREESSHILQAIDAIERLVRSNGKRRGRPPKWLAREPHAIIPALHSKKTPNLSGVR